MITVANLIINIEPYLDAEGSGYYTFERDYRPAINSAMRWLVSLLQFAKEKTKISGEFFRDLNYVRVFQTNRYSRISFNHIDLGHYVWSIEGIYPKIIYEPAGLKPIPLTNLAESMYDDRVTYISSKYSASRLTNEEWNINEENPFKAGNTIFDGCADLVIYAYRNFADYTSGNYSITYTKEIEIRPILRNEFVGIEYIAVPTDIVNTTDSIPYPESMMELLTQKVLNIISVKQGDQTNLYAITERDLNNFLTFIN